MTWVDPCPQRFRTAAGELVMRLGVPQLDAHLAFLAARSRPNTVLAVAYDLRVFFTMVGKPPAQVTAADALLCSPWPGPLRPRDGYEAEPVDSVASHAEVIGHWNRGVRMDCEPEPVKGDLEFAYVVDANPLGEKLPDPVVVAVGVGSFRLGQTDSAVAPRRFGQGLDDGQGIPGSPRAQYGLQDLDRQLEKIGTQRVRLEHQIGGLGVGGGKRCQCP
jgi:hypothetical protein